MEIRIREVESSDRRAWCRLRAMLWPDQTPEQHAIELNDWEKDGQLPITFVAEEAGGELVGFLEVALRNFAPGCESSPVPFIEGWFVQDAHRGQGIGALLLEMAERWAVANGYRELASDSLIENALSETAHLAAGFAEVERLICWRKDLKG
jgi:aminoglycoside 6'-N-acetyltransferase I